MIFEARRLTAEETSRQTILDKDDASSFRLEWKIGTWYWLRWFVRGLEREISLSLSGEKGRRRKRRIKCRERDRREEFFFELFQMILEIIIQKSGERLLTELSGRIIELPLRGGMQFKTSIINGHVLDGLFERDFVGNEGNVTLQPLECRNKITEMGIKKGGKRKKRREKNRGGNVSKRSRHRRGVCDHG